jgi:hypothetical protein
MLGPQDIQKLNIDSPPAAPVAAPDGVIVTSAAEGEDYAKRKIAEILGDDPEKVEDYKVAALYKYTQDKGAKSIEDVLWEIRYIANRLGTPGYGESRLNYLYEYIYLLNESKSVEDKLKKMEVFNNGK